MYPRLGTLFFAAMLLVGGFFLPRNAYALSGDEIKAATGISQGLCVLAGFDDGSAAASLAASGTLLVHSLYLEEKSVESARQAIRLKGVYGLASAERVKSLRQLPYAENLVNLMVIDNDALGAQAPSAEEVDRALVPNGIAYVKASGSWKKRVKPMPSGMDEWKMQNHGADGNPLSNDRLVKMPNTVKWLSWYGHHSRDGEGLYGPTYYEIRAGGGRIFQQPRFKNIFFKPQVEVYPIDVRDAFNGIAQWQQITAIPKSPRGFSPLLVEGNRFFTVLKQDGPLVELEAGTGKLVRSFDKAGNLTAAQQSVYPVWTEGTIVQAAGHRLVRFNPDNGNVLWDYSEGGAAIAFPAVSVDKSKVFALVGISAAGPGTGQSGAGKRHPAQKSAAVIAVDLATGKRLWRTALSEPNNRITQLTYGAGIVGVYAAWTATTGKGDSSTNFMGALNPDNGSWLWTGDARMGTGEKWSTAGNAPQYFALRDGRFFNLYKQKYYELDPRTGNLLDKMIANVPNNRCLRPYLTPDLVVMGFGIYVDKSKRMAFTNIARSTCGSAGFPAYGHIYNGPNGQCQCFNMLRWATALSNETLLGDTPDKERLELGSVAAPSSSAGAAVQPDTFYFGGSFPARKPIITGNPIRDDWNNNDYLPAGETEAVTLGNRKFVGITNEHRLECRQGTEVVWSFTAGGRITNAPVLTHGMAIFGSHDGYVYALRQSDGRLVWKFLAARNERRIGAFSQLESSHPVFGAILHKGTVSVSAGRHPEIDGGIFVWGLDPVKGAIAWKSVFRTDHPWVDHTSKHYSTFKNLGSNGVLASNGEFLKLPGVTIDPKNPSAPSSLTGKPEGVSRPGCRLINGRFGLELEFDAEGVSVEIYGMGGQHVMQHHQVTGTRALIPMSGMNRGRYVLVARNMGKEIIGKFSINHLGSSK